MRTKSIIAALLLLCLYSKAQQHYLEQIATENISITKNGDNISVAMDINFTDLTINTNHLLIITPVISSDDQQDSLKLSPVLVTGARRNIQLNRQKKTELSQYASSTLVRKNGSDQQLHYTTSVPFNEWQRKAGLSLDSEVIGCADCLEEKGHKHLVNKILADKFKPDFVMTYIVPEAEPVKQRSEEYSARLSYIVGKHELIPSYGSNTAELEKVDRSINVLKADPDLTITDITISGYASPEGSSHSNLLLSQRRAETFASYLEKRSGYGQNQFKVVWKGEDWDGLRKAVEASDIANKQVVLDIIDNTPDEDERDGKIIALDNRQTYNLLLKEFYPPLRRNDYNIAFISRAFNVEEAKEVLLENPKKLSLNEMYLVAHTYPKDSKEFRQVFDIAARTFPDSEISALNASITDLNNNDTDTAIRRLNKISGQPKALSLLGMAYIKKGEYDKASAYLREAAQQGDPDARHNIEQLQLLIENN